MTPHLKDIDWAKSRSARITEVLSPLLLRFRCQYRNLLLEFVSRRTLLRFSGLQFRYLRLNPPLLLVQLLDIVDRIFNYRRLIHLKFPRNEQANKPNFRISSTKTEQSVKVLAYPHWQVEILKKLETSPLISRFSG